MGLFRKAHGSGGESTWANNATNTKISASGNGSSGNSGRTDKRPLSHSITSQEETIATDEGYTLNAHLPASADSKFAALSNRVQVLERQLRQRDATISQLRQTMDAEERVQSERIHILERQLEKLVEFSSKECAQQGKTSLMLISKGTQGSREAKVEISALQELSSKLIAEKDRLAFENSNLKKLLKEQNHHASSKCKALSRNKQDYDNRIPPSIEELDSMMHKLKHFEKKKAIALRRRSSPDDCNTNALVGSKCSQRRNSEKLHKDANSGHQQAVLLYQMSCRHCPKDHSHVTYMGACSTMIAATNSSQDSQGGLLPTQLAYAESQLQLKMLLKQHFLQVWEMSQKYQEDGHSISSSVHEEEMSGNLKNDDSGSGWRTSSLARHLAKHCQQQKSAKEVLHWCMENVKVEVEKPQEYGSTNNFNRGQSKDYHTHCTKTTSTQAGNACTPSYQEKRINKANSWSKSG